MFSGLENSNTYEELLRAQAVIGVLQPRLIKPMEIFGHVFVILTGFFTTPFDMLFRTEHGERDISPLRLVNSFGAMKLFFFVSAGISFLISLVVGQFGLSGFLNTQIVTIDVSPIFQAAFIVAGLYHLYRINLRNRRGEHWHSHSWGYSWLEIVGIPEWVNARLANMQLFGRWSVPFRLDAWFIYRFLEPLMALALSQVVGGFDAPTGLWLLVASGFLFWRNNLVYAQQRNRLLDYWDAQIEASNMKEATQGAPVRETAGLMVIPGFTEMIAPAQDLNIDKRVKDTLSS